MNLVNRIFWTTFISSLLLFFVSLTSGQNIDRLRPTDTRLGGSHAIVGTVFGPSGQRSDRRLSIRITTQTRGDIVAMTDDNGEFAFSGITDGTFEISINKEKDFEGFTQQVSFARGQNATTQTLVIKLVAKRGTAVKPGVVNSQFANVPVQAMTFYNAALKLAGEGNHTGAIEQLRQATEQHPDFMLAFNEMGVQYMRLNDLTQADASFVLALKIEPDALAPLTNRGIVLFQLKRYVEAEPILRKAVKIKDDVPVGHYFLGQTLANLGSFDEAEKELIIAVKNGGEAMKEAHRILAIIFGARGEKKKAAAELETYLKLAPRTPDAEQIRKVIAELKGG